MSEAATRETLMRAEDLCQFCTDVLETFEIPAEDARFTAGTLVEADLRGVHSHGTLLMLGYADRLRGGATNPKPNIRVINDYPATALLDGNDGLGQVISKRAMEIAIAKAGSSGIASVGVMNSNHYGAGAYWPMMALGSEMIGFAVTIAGINVAPWGGITPLFGTNPWSIAIPAGEELPIVVDISTTMVACGKLHWAARRDESIPLGWALDTDGRPTTDPIAGAVGRMISIAGYKGYGLGLVVEVLAGALTGATLGYQLAPLLSDAGKPLNLGHFFMAIDTGIFVPRDQFKGRVDAMIREMKKSECEPGVEEILLPGEKEYRLERERRKEGIPMPLKFVAELETLAERTGVQAPWKY